MRTIKFRAILNKEARTNKIYEDWIKPIYFTLQDLMRGKVTFLYPEHWQFDEYTGILDKNGKEIYEGDIMKHCAHYPHDYQERNPKKKFGRVAGPVQWTKGWLYLDYDGKETGDNDILYEQEAQQWEVIGNLYENPELLSGAVK